MLLQDLVKKEGIKTEPEVFGFTKWTEWACNYKTEQLIKILEQRRINDLFTFFTQALLEEDREEYINKSAERNSIITQGRTIIPKIGNYMKKIDDLLHEADTEELNWVKYCYVNMLHNITIKEKIFLDHTLLNFDEWTEWACSYEP